MKDHSPLCFCQENYVLHIIRCDVSMFPTRVCCRNCLYRPKLAFLHTHIFFTCTAVRRPCLHILGERIPNHSVGVDLVQHVICVHRSWVDSLLVCWLQCTGGGERYAMAMYLQYYIRILVRRSNDRQPLDLSGVVCFVSRSSNSQGC